MPSIRSSWIGTRHWSPQEEFAAIDEPEVVHPIDDLECDGELCVDALEIGHGVT